MNILVLYKSKYGSAKKYANMINEKLNTTIDNLDHYNFKNINQYDLIIITCGVYATGLPCIKQLKKHTNLLKDKNIVILAIGASPFDQNAFEKLKEHNSTKLSYDIPIFYARGCYDETIMTFKDRTLCRLLKKSLTNKTPDTLEPWMQAFIETNGKNGNWIDESYLAPLFKYIDEM